MRIVGRILCATAALTFVWFLARAGWMSLVSVDRPPEALILLPLGAAFLLLVGAFVWIRRLMAGEGGPPAWRYRDRSRVGPRVVHRTEHKPSRLSPVSARRWMRLLLTIGIGMTLLALATAVGSALSGPVFGRTSWAEAWVTPVALACMLAGLGLMVRIYRRPLEDEPPAWRYRDRD